jgi:hypothetical protein
VRLEEAAYSRGYAQLTASLTAVFSGRLACPTTVATVFLPLGGAAGL